MNNDRELLELAANAAAYEIDFDNPVNGWYVNGYDENGDPAAWWNPLIDDGDALRLAVKLSIEVDIANTTRNLGGCTKAWYFYGKTDLYIEERHNDDPYEATRRAIVRAAAEIGRTM